MAGSTPVDWFFVWIVRVLILVWFDLLNLYFYAFQAVPPLIAKDLGEQAQRIADQLEVEKSQEWYAHFLGTAFLIHGRVR